ncbi:MAG: PSD1 and planctomycete cytochrome C domain-containing protein [Phycisphaeraceae bacterium]
MSTSPAGAEEVSFNRDIRPILSNNCFACHGPDADSLAAELRLDRWEFATAALDSDGRAAIVPGHPDRSEMFARITAEDPRDLMPPDDPEKRLTEEQVALIRAWIEQGASYEAHWAFVPPEQPDVPRVHDESWPSNWIDRFVLARLEAENVKPSPQADRATLIRRLSFDLRGLPPTLQEVEAFVADARPDAYERLVETYLASPHYGERMAVYWLDLVRYADTVGYHGDQDHHAGPYRDWVIDAINDNMPFDQFTIEQLAGDLLENPSTDQKIASAYNRLLQTSHEGGIQDAEYHAKQDSDRVRNASSVWMGVTLGCAECHDHKFDPFTAEDFYAFAAFFADIQERGDWSKLGGNLNTVPTRRPPEIDVLTGRQRAQLTAVKAQLTELNEQLQQIDEHDARRENLRTRQSQLRQQRDQIADDKRRVMITVARDEPRQLRVLPRGDWLDDSGPVVQPAIPAVFGKLDVPGRATRLDLARWLVDDQNPLTARVYVNRLWYLFFGTGLSSALDDLGYQGEWPAHPELLDALAVAFVQSGWDAKHMTRLLVTSQAYRQSSRIPSELRERDPENRLIARQSRWRLPAEFIRDNALSVSGLLVDSIGGPSVRPYQPEGYYGQLNFPTRQYTASTGPAQYRRGVYVHWQRTYLHPAMMAFDASSREECVAQRPISNTPLAALTLLNDPTFVEAARVFAQRLLTEHADLDDDQRLTLAFVRVTARQPTDRELDLLRELLHAQRQDDTPDPEAAQQLAAVGQMPVPDDLDLAELAAWTAITRALLNLDESITRH